MSDHRATIYDVAQRAGVSHQTVARLVRGNSNINPEMRARITTAIEELDYRPNLAARDLRNRKSRLLGAIVSNTSELGPSRDVQGAIAAARESGYTLDVVSIDPTDPANYREAVEQFEAKDVAGILVQASTDELAAAAASHHTATPLYVEHADESEGVGPALVDAEGTELLVRHLLEAGHRQFHYIAGPTNWVSARVRLRSFLGALAGAGAGEPGVSYGDWSARSGYESVARLDDPLGFTALVAANDQMALGALRAFAERGVTVPTQVSVAGFDDLPDSEFYQPPLTTIAQDSDRQGRQAIQRLLEIINDGLTVDDSPIRARLVVRGSTGAQHRDSL